MTGISLPEASAESRNELYPAQDESAGQPFESEAECAQLSLEVEYRLDGETGAKAEAGTLDSEASGNIGEGPASTRRQVLTLNLVIRDEACGAERAGARGPSAAPDPYDGPLRHRPGAEPTEGAVTDPTAGAAQRPGER
ncbi:trypco2 family protein [Streptomyces avermitilis]|uniref:trypco2 family protein n=1 Tax=Streptomyces avermitilis TaxID=33903 RepID=UPI0033AFA2E1